MSIWSLQGATAYGTCDSQGAFEIGDSPTVDQCRSSRSSSKCFRIALRIVCRSLRIVCRFDRIVFRFCSHWKAKCFKSRLLIQTLWIALSRLNTLKTELVHSELHSELRAPSRWLSRDIRVLAKSQWIELEFEQPEICSSGRRLEYTIRIWS